MPSTPRFASTPSLRRFFARAIPGDWQPHLTKMYAFWSSVMLTTGRYKGNPVVKHLVIPGIRPHLFELWLALFDETCGELFDEGISEQFRVKAARIAESLKLALFYRPDRPWLATGVNRMTLVVTENCIKSNTWIASKFVRWTASTGAKICS
jgi:hemoglobin